MVFEKDKEFTVENRSGIMKLKVIQEKEIEKVGNHSGLGSANGVRIEIYDENTFSVDSNEWDKTIYFITTNYKDKHCWKCEVISTEQPKSDLKICEEQW